jgi:hypothetical protein
VLNDGIEIKAEDDSAVSAPRQATFVAKLVPVLSCPQSLKQLNIRKYVDMPLRAVSLHVNMSQVTIERAEHICRTDNRRRHDRVVIWIMRHNVEIGR